MKKQSELRFRIIAVTCATTGEGRTIARALLRKQLAACVNILEDVESYYLWKGKIEKSAECLLLIKTKKTLVSKAVDKIKELHSYECPVIEVIASEIIDGKAIQWFNSVLMT